MAESEAKPPVLQVIRGDGGGDVIVEIAALLAVLTARGGAQPEPPKARTAWGDPATLLQGQLHVGPGGWRAFALPH